MEMVMIVLGVLIVMAAIDWQRHERDMRLRAERVRAKHERSRLGASPDA